MFLEFKFRKGLFYAKKPKSYIFILPLMDQHVWGALAPQGDLVALGLNQDKLVANEVMCVYSQSQHVYIVS
jgi:hypothetical protein